MRDQSFIDHYVELLPSKNVSQSEAESRAGEFLLAVAHISNMRHLYSNDKIKAESMERIIYGKLITSLKGTKITENKILVESNPEYQLVREELERIQSDMEHLKHFQDIFMNAHVFYRQVSKGDL